MRNPQNDSGRIKRSVRPERRRESAEVEGRVAQPSSRRPSTSLSTSDRDSDRHTPERSCILTRRKSSKDEFIRLALGPNGQVAPDIRARAPGRGAWIGVDRDALDEAHARGKLKAALQRAFKQQALDVPADIGARTADALRQAVLDRLGMEARAGNLVTGAERIEAAARAGKVSLLIHAADAGEDGSRRLDQALRVGGGHTQGVHFPEDRIILSMALGRENVVHLALTDAAAASRVDHALVRWRGFSDPVCGPDGGNTASGPNTTEEDVKD